MQIKKIVSVTLIILGLVGTIAGVIAAYYSLKSYDIIEEDANMQLIPFFEYRFDEEKDAFIVESEDNKRIRKIKWLFSFSTTTSNYGARGIPNNSLTTEKIFDVIWFLLLEKRILLHNPSNNEATRGYIKCEILHNYFEANNVIEGNPGLPLGVIIEYNLKGEEGYKRTVDLLLIRNTKDESPQVSIFKPNASDNEITEFMRKGGEHLIKAIETREFNEGKKYLDEDGKCTSNIETFERYQFE